MTRQLPSGRTPWDPAVGFRVGTIAGGLLGLAVGGLTALPTAPAILGGSVIGAGVGYWTEKRKQGPDGNGGAASP
ncbi:MAG: hypothetical protein HKN26_02050 [Acidimicrobiales bacterium]|nr:hypothetical protein [Acidimicrobiales bacterium]